jgi:hypothetical protein
MGSPRRKSPRLRLKQRIYNNREETGIFGVAQGLLAKGNKVATLLFAVLLTAPAAADPPFAHYESPSQTPSSQLAGDNGKKQKAETRSLATPQEIIDAAARAIDAANKAQAVANAEPPSKSDWVFSLLLVVLTGCLVVVGAFQAWIFSRQAKIMAHQVKILVRADRTSRQALSITGRQTDIIEKQHAIGRMQYIADKRPRLRVRHVSIIRPTPIGSEKSPLFKQGEKIRGSLVVVNIGGIEARIIESRYCFYWGKESLPMDPPLEEAFSPLFGGEVPPLIGGESRGIPVESLQAMDEHANDFLADQGKWHIYIIGMVRYADISFPPVERFMGFCRVYRRPASGPGEGRFYAVENDPDYEYED